MTHRGPCQPQTFCDSVRYKKFHVNVSKSFFFFFFIKVVKDQDREAVESPALETPKTQPEAARGSWL